MADQNAERTAQAQQRRQRYLDYTLKVLRARYLQRKAQEILMEHPNATWNDFSIQLINKDVTYQVSSSFLNDQEQNKSQMACLGQELKNLRTELREHRVNAVEGNQKLNDPNQKGRQNATRICGYCRTNDTLLASAEKRYETKKSKSFKMNPEPRKKLRSPRTTTKDVEPPTDLGSGRVGTMMINPDDH